MIGVSPMRLTPVTPGAECEGLAHDLHEHVPADHTIYVSLTRDIVASIDLCAACAADLD